MKRKKQAQAEGEDRELEQEIKMAMEAAEAARNERIAWEKRTGKKAPPDSLIFNEASKKWHVVDHDRTVFEHGFATQKAAWRWIDEHSDDQVIEAARAGGCKEWEHSHFYTPTPEMLQFHQDILSWQPAGSRKHKHLQ